jgi:hypothetical protein
LNQVMAVLSQHGFAQASVVGEVARPQTDQPMLRVM